jgi:hypothetical protein
MVRIFRSPRVSLCLAVILSSIAALFLPTIALAAVDYYDGVSALNPGGYYSSFNPDYTRRLYNEACRSGNSGQMSVSYIIQGGGSWSSSVQWTNCGQGALVSIGDSYYSAMSRCTNQGTVSFFVDCITTKP